MERQHSCTIVDITAVSKHAHHCVKTPESKAILMSLPVSNQAIPYITQTICSMPGIRKQLSTRLVWLLELQNNGNKDVSYKQFL
jgi:hypothetical protein